jgi:hypothetical protein
MPVGHVVRKGDVRPYLLCAIRVGDSVDRRSVNAGRDGLIGAEQVT